MALMGADMVQQHPLVQASITSKSRAHTGPDLFSLIQLAVHGASRLKSPAPLFLYK